MRTASVGKMVENQLVPVQLRLPQGQIDELKAAGDAALPKRRSLPAEILHRLEIYKSGGPRDESFAHAVGELVAAVVRTVEPTLGSGSLSPQDLGVIRDAVVAVFNDGLRAADPADKEELLPLSRWAAFPFNRWLKSDPPMLDTPPFIKRITGRLAPAQAALDLDQKPTAEQAQRRAPAKLSNKS